jgi:hypothetical protein
VKKIIKKAVKSEPEQEVDLPVKEETTADMVFQEDKDHKPKKSLKDRLLKGPKWLLITEAVVLPLLIIVALPFTRYSLLGTFVKKSVTVKIVDSQTNTPISEASVEIQGKSQRTNSDGVATLSGVKVGKANISVSKKYYETLTFKSFVGLATAKSPEIKLVAQGRPLKFNVVNKITKEAIKDVSLKTGDSEALSDEEGETVLVVPVNVTEIELTTARQGFNDLTQKLKVADLQDKDNTLEITPAGKIYFLSKQSGKIDVVKTNLDGTERQIVLAGTGNEVERDTILLASRDWKYLALKAKRDTKKDFNNVYVINTADDKLSVIDEGNAAFELKGWAGHNLIFKVDRNEAKFNAADKQRLKSFNAENQKLIVLDRNGAADLGPGISQNYYYTQRYYYDSFALVSLTDDTVLYVKDAAFSGGCEWATNGIYTIKPDGSQKKAILEAQIKDKDIEGWSAFTYKPGEIYYQTNEPYCTNTQQPIKSYEYELGGDIKIIEESEFNKGRDNYVSFVVSPNGKETFWSESRDGKNVFFLGDLDLENKKEITRQEEHDVYGWYNQEYLLVSKKSSELFIMPRNGGELTKVTDYHKPSYDYRGYGYGYGGL